MESFCDGAFWDTDLLSNSSWPELTPCFMDVVFPGAPCVLFWLIVPIHVYLTHTRTYSEPRPFLTSRLDTAKLVCGCCTIALVVSRLVCRDVRADHGYGTLVVSVVLLFTLMMATLMTQYERHRGVLTSPSMFVFWWLKTLCDAALFYSHTMLLQGHKKTWDYVLLGLSGPVTAVIAVLYCFSDCSARHQLAGDKISPEITASFLSKITFFWFTRLVVRGYRHGVTLTDVWDLIPRDQSDSLMPTFHRLWQREQHSSLRPSKVSIRRKKQTRRKAKSGQGDEWNDRTPLLSSNIQDGDSTWGTVYETYSANVNSQCESEDSVGDGPNDQPDVLPSLGRTGDSGQKGPSLVRVLVQQLRGQILVCVVQRLVHDATIVISPLLLGAMISQTSKKEDERSWPGYLLAVALCVVLMLKSVVFGSGSYRAYYTGLHVKSVLTNAIYQKALRLNNASRKQFSAGEIVNMMAVDAQRVQEFFNRLFFGMLVPVFFSVIVVVIYLRVGLAVVPGLLVLVAMVTMTTGAGVMMKRYQERLLVHKDHRIKVFNEILSGIKVLKLYAWEESFEQKVLAIRNSELSCLRKIAFCSIVQGVSFNMVTYLMTLAIFAFYLLWDPSRHLEADLVFVVMTLMVNFMPAFDSLGNLVSFWAQAKVSLARIKEFLVCEELRQDVRQQQDDKYAIKVQGATFTWGSPESPTLKNVDMTVRGGRLMAVVGQVGSGKTSLISALLGEMTTLAGDVNLQGSVAYVPQEAWIQNATIRDNILFGLPYDHSRYEAVVRACQLERDLHILAAGDRTEIGEKGTNLSGGQKQRVSLARAVYSDRDIYLLDDPLSAVDSHVGTAIFDNVIGGKGLLKNKTRVLVTHGVRWLPLVDEIIVLNQGQIKEKGSYSSLIQRDGDFASFLKTYAAQGLDSEDDADGDVEEEQDETGKESADRPGSASSTDNGNRPHHYDTAVIHTHGHHSEKGHKFGKRRQTLETEEQFLPVTEGSCGQRSLSMHSADWTSDADQGQLIAAETLATGTVPLKVYMAYPRAGGLVIMTLTTLLFVLYRAANVWSNVWLKQWTQDPFLHNQTTHGSAAFVHTNHTYLLYYGIFGVAQLVVQVVYNTIYWLRTVRASRHLHKNLVHSILRAPIAFFDTTPIGRIVNRISSDMDVVDTLLPLIIRDALSCVTVMLATIIIIIVASPIIAVGIVPLVAFSCFALMAYIPTSRQCKRMEAVTRSPVFAYSNETITGGASIRAYGATERFITEFKRRVDKNLSFYCAWLCGMRWVQICMELVCNVVVFLAAVLSLQGHSSGPSMGLSVYYALQMSYTIVYLVRQLSDLESNIVSVERIQEYSQLPSEAEWVEPSKRPSPEWPQKGCLEFSKYKTRYRPGLELVLKGISCHIRPGEKIGVVGRTGAGKSSLALALFRLIESAEGAILLDGVNIAHMGLHDLRNRLTILPQDPVLFSGSLRFNLDPFQQHSDHELWQAIEQAHLKDVVCDLPGKLNHEFDEGGINMSVGQRQLVCLARTLVRKTKVLVLDEATAAVDMDTDQLIQDTVHTAFSHCTVITIAHRLNTILDYDRILVLEAGRIQEFDSPQNLQANPDSAFSAMLRDAGIGL